MTKIHSYTKHISADIVDAFCELQENYTDQFVYYRKDRPVRYMGLGRCIALRSLSDIDCSLEGEATTQPIFFSFNRFDAENPQPADELFEAFPRLRYMLPEIVLIQSSEGTFLQVNSLGVVRKERAARFEKLIARARPRKRSTIPFQVVSDSRDQWRKDVDQALSAIEEGSLDKVVLSRRCRVLADRSFSSKELLVNLIDGSSPGTVLLYRYADVFFCGCTPELLVRKCGTKVESMCLAGTGPKGVTQQENDALAQELYNDKKNRDEHNHVVDYIRSVFQRVCHGVEVPYEPSVLSLTHMQHLYTPAHAFVLAGMDLWTLANSLHPTPAVSGAPVGEALMLIRRIEAYSRGYFAGACGFVDAAGDGEFSVALRSGVFDGETGWIYAGCGIVPGSIAHDEYDEISTKMKTILSAFEGDEFGE